MSRTLVQIESVPPSSHAQRVDAFAQAAELERALRSVIHGEVRFDRGTRALYATDGSNYRHIPIGVVIPRTREDVIATVRLCRQFGAPLLSRGAGTSLAGQCCNVAVILDFSKYLNRVLEINPEESWVRVEPGIVLDHLQRQVKSHGLFFAPDPATHSHCTLGGMIGNNSCGSHALYGGKTDDNTIELEVLLYDGTVFTVGPTTADEIEAIISEGGRRAEVYAGLYELRNQYASLISKRFPQIPRRVSGYNLNELLQESGFQVARSLVGSEGTCVVVLSAKLRLMKSPPFRTLAVLGYPDIFTAADDVPRILTHNPIALEGFDGTLVRQMKKKMMLLNNIALLPQGDGWLFVEFGAFSEAESREQADAFVAMSGNTVNAIVVASAIIQRHLWEVRESALGATAVTLGDPHRWEGWEDHAVSPEHLGSYLRDFQKLLDEFGYSTAYYGHFGQGCVHVRVNFDLQTTDGIRAFRGFLDRAADVVVQHGGSLSGEHGDGQARGALLERMYGPELMAAFMRFKDLWDPTGMMNPGKLIRANQPHADLRFGADYKPAEPETAFAFTRDGGSFAHATERCVGVGKCRKEQYGTMCPSYMATRDERHSTRGRAHALFEMLQGEVLGGRPGKEMWNDEDVKDTLDLCLSCKACKSECPVSVDMATYKAEFMYHYYKANPRPLHAYAFGYIDRFASAANMISPELGNLLLKIPGTSSVTKWILGIDPRRTIPELAPRSFQSTWNASPRQPGLKDVVLWPDTFTNYFDPHVSQAAARVLASAGFNVFVPHHHVCCGRPLYDFGFLDAAKKYMLRNVNRISAQIDAGIPVVVLEPSCASVFRDDAPDLLPDNPLVQKLATQTYLLSEFLEKFAPEWQPAKWDIPVVMQAHCHHRAIFQPKTQEMLLEKLSADVTPLDTGCCGMAGPFGFEKDKFEVSQTLAERGLAPAARAASLRTAILADGFSCREAIKQSTLREGIHLAELLDLSSRRDRDSASPEALSRAPLNVERSRIHRRIAIGLIVAAVIICALYLSIGPHPQ